MVDCVAHQTSFKNMLLQRNKQIDVWEQAVIIKMDVLNKLFEELSWEWHKQWWFILLFIVQELLMQLYGWCVLIIHYGFTLMYQTWKQVPLPTIYGQKQSFHWIDCMTFTYLDVQYRFLRRNLVMENLYQDGKLDHNAECI